ncbi:MAG: cytochrome bc complex cytochrome b subunit [Pirellulales bacterium]|nr:cytochrome bc complex cytochrome b subunit [Pirellulales bacterium]
MRKLYYWLDDRTGALGALKAFREARVPGRACPCRAMPFLLVFAFLAQGITGLFMLMYYSPGAQSAWESVHHLQYDVTGGWILRAAHHYGGQAFLVLAGLYLVGMVLRGAYRAPREFVFWTAVLLVLVSLGSLLTGDLLAWDQNSQSSTLVRTKFLALLPGVGAGLFKLAAGGPDFGHLTLTRFLALHTIVMAGALAVLLALRAWFARRAAAMVQDEVRFFRPFWPTQFLINVGVCVLFLVVIGALVASHGVAGPERGVELGAPADATDFYAAARPEWAFMGLYGFSNLFPGELKLLPIFVIPGIVVVLLFLMPFIARLGVLGHALNVLVLLGLLAADAGLSWMVVVEDRANEHQQAALAEGRRDAERARELIALRGGIPVEGALTLLQEDPKAQGPKLFRQHCASCHAFVGGTDEDIPASEVSSPNLFGYGTRAWIAGWLDPDKIKSDDRFGKTAFRNGKMAQFVKDTFSDLEKEDEEERDLMVAALSAEAALPAQADLDKKDSERIAEGRDLLADCTDCHKYRKGGSLGTAPELTGYGSRDWTLAILANPAHPRFYGDRNDRMPIYAPTADDAKNVLSRRELELLTDWLRGQWVEP